MIDNTITEGTRLIVRDIKEEMESAFIDYSMSVITARALPDVRDGLKPVHRRILYTMHERGNDPSHPTKKSADTVGAVLGSYHPHGDASVYDAMVRLAQDFSMRYPLVEGQGNFGSVDGDPPAAYRYTEARMSKMSVDLMRDIEKGYRGFRAELRRVQAGTQRAALPRAEPAHQRLQRHCRGYGHQYSAPQHAGGHRRHRRADP